MVVGGGEGRGGGKEGEEGGRVPKSNLHSRKSTFFDGNFTAKIGDFPQISKMR